MSQQEYYTKMFKWFKFLARFTGLLVCLFFMAFIIGEGLPDILNGNGVELIPLVPLILLPVVGYVVAWQRPWGGGLLLIAGALILLVYFLIEVDIKMAIIYSIPFLITGILFLLQVKMFNKIKNL